MSKMQVDFCVQATQLQIEKKSTTTTKNISQKKKTKQTGQKHPPPPNQTELVAKLTFFAELDQRVLFRGRPAA